MSPPCPRSTATPLILFTLYSARTPASAMYSPGTLNTSKATCVSVSQSALWLRAWSTHSRFPSLCCPQPSFVKSA